MGRKIWLNPEKGLIQYRVEGEMQKKAWLLGILTTQERCKAKVLGAGPSDLLSGSSPFRQTVRVRKGRSAVTERGQRCCFYKGSVQKTSLECLLMTSVLNKLPPVRKM